MLKPLATLAALFVCCASLAQAPATDPGAPASGTGLKPSKGSGLTPSPGSATAPSKTPEQAGPPPTSMEEIFACLAPGLPRDWRTVTVEVIEVSTDGSEHQFEARYSYTRTKQPKAVPLAPCDAVAPARNVRLLNQFLEPEKRQWTRAMLTFRNDGKFDLTYDYSK